MCKYDINIFSLLLLTRMEILYVSFFSFHFIYLIFKSSVTQTPHIATMFHVVHFIIIRFNKFGIHTHISVESVTTSTKRFQNNNDEIYDFGQFQNFVCKWKRIQYAIPNLPSYRLSLMIAQANMIWTMCCNLSFSHHLQCARIHRDQIEKKEDAKKEIHQFKLNRNALS